MISAIILMTGLMAGIYFTFSVFVMKALSQLPGAEGARAMNRINGVIVKTAFLPLFFVSTLAHLWLIVWSALFLGGIASNIFWAGVVYVVGMFAVTLLGNVPLNNRLKANEKADDVLLETWHIYLLSWTRLNHIRTFSCCLSLVLLVAGGEFIGS